jgi:hypothetical protein
MAWELDKKAEDAILQNSIERVINTTTNQLVRRSQNKGPGKADWEDLEVNIDDWAALKYIVCLLWDRERNRIFMERVATHKKEGGQ